MTATSLLKANAPNSQCTVAQGAGMGLELVCHLDSNDDQGWISGANSGFFGPGTRVNHGTR